MSFWFGEPWPDADLRAPICEDDRMRVPVPIGAGCVLCGEAIGPDDRGSSTTVVGLERAEQGWTHVECSVRTVLGNLTHVKGDCHHTGDCNRRSTQSYRQEALEIWRWLGDQ